MPERHVLEAEDDRDGAADLGPAQYGRAVGEVDQDIVLAGDPGLGEVQDALGGAVAIADRRGGGIDQHGVDPRARQPGDERGMRTLCFLADADHRHGGPLRIDVPATPIPCPTCLPPH